MILGREQTDSPHIFLKVQYPFGPFKRKECIAKIFQRRLKNAGINRTVGDGKTLHGVRRIVATEMTSEGIPLTTVAQVLGHQDLKTTKQYISLDFPGLSNCVLGFEVLGGQVDG